MQGPVRAAEDLELALLPMLGTHAMVEAYQPLRAYLEPRLGRPLVLLSARDTRDFIERTRRAEYPYVLTAAHFARLAERESGYRPLLGVERALCALIAVPAAAAVEDIADLRGLDIAIPGSLSLEVMLAEDQLAEAGLRVGRDVYFTPYASFGTALRAVEQGRAQAAVTNVTALRQLAPARRARLRVVAESRPVQNLVLLAAPQVPAERADVVAEALARFTPQTLAGSGFYAQTGHRGLRRLEPGELAALDPYVERLRARMPPRAP
jgi:ABC-type phosphate/phosphonate transport system substrate-binding protein